MRRARLFAASLLVRAARLLAGDDEAKAPVPPEEEEDEGLPLGIVMTRSPEAERMLLEGLRGNFKPKDTTPEPPLRGSLRDRMQRRTP
jgi:hypothetical protein